MLEELCGRALCRLLGLAATTDATFMYSGTYANQQALYLALHRHAERRGFDLAQEGIVGFGDPNRLAVLVSADAHFSLRHAARMLGLGEAALVALPVDANRRIDALRARHLITDLQTEREIVAVVATAGTTNTGAIDPLQAIGELAKENAIWYHVDGAYGLPGILDKNVSHHYQGLELADSVIVDPHKWLGASVGIAATFVRDRQLLYRAFTQEPSDYLEGSVEQGDTSAPAVEHSLDDFGIPYFDFGVELSAPCRGVVVWALIREIGVEGIRQRIERHNQMARRLSQQANAHLKLEVLSEPTISICCFRYRPAHSADIDRFNQSLHRRLVRENEYMPSTTRVRGQLALRPCYIGARAHPDQVDALIDSVVRIGQDLETELRNGIKENRP